MEKMCSNCKYSELDADKDPCNICDTVSDYSQWVLAEEVAHMEKHCTNCMYAEAKESEYPCSVCDISEYSEWEELEKLCGNCLHYPISIHDNPCVDCNREEHSLWEAAKKEEPAMDENEKIRELQSQLGEVEYNMDVLKRQFVTQTIDALAESVDMLSVVRYLAEKYHDEVVIVAHEYNWDDCGSCPKKQNCDDCEKMQKMHETLHEILY